MKGIVRVGAVNCDEHKDLASAFGVKGFPTIKIFPSKMTPSKDGKGYHKAPIDYNGARTAADISNFAVEQLPSELAKVLLFTDKSSTSNLYKALSIDFHHALNLAEVRKSENEIIKKYEINKFPSLLVITPSGETIPYEGQLKHEALFTFLSKYAKKIQNTNAEQQSTSGSKKSSTPPPPPPPEPARSVREEVTDQETFEKLCSVNCLLYVFDPSNTEPELHENYLKIFESVNEKWKKYFNFVWVDASKQTDVVETFQLYSGFPTGLVVNKNKMSYIPYFGSLNEEKLEEFFEGILAGKKAAKLNKFPTLVTPPSSKSSTKEETD